MRILIISLLLSSYVFSATNYEKSLSLLKKTYSNHKDITTLINLGPNDQGTDVIGIKIGNRGSGHLVVGAHHGNETKSVTVSFTLIDDIIKIYRDKSHPDHSKFVSRSYHIIPVLNVTGYNANNRYEKGPNGRRVDPNRDYPDPCQNNSHFQLKSTAALARYIENNDVVSAITIHGYIGTFTFPWGTYAKNTHSPDHEKFLNWAMQAAVHNNYEVGTHADVIYPAVGSFEDWAYHSLGVWAMLLELDHYPNYANDSLMMLSFLSNVPASKSQNHEHGACRTNLTRDQLLMTRP